MKEKIAIVTGGTGNLGRIIVKKLAENDFRVYIPSLNLDIYKDVFDSSRYENESYKLREIYSFYCDAFNEESVKKFINDISTREDGKIDFLINTIGGYQKQENIIDMGSDVLENMLNLNFRSAFFFSREVIKIMKKNNFGRIISIGAIAGLGISPGRFAYSVSKSALVNLMDTVSEEMKMYNVRCNTIVPSVIDTPENRKNAKGKEIDNWVSPEEISEIVLCLLNDSFRSVKGSTIKVFGNY